MYVVVGSALVGGLTAWVGEGETGVWTGVGLDGVIGGWVAVGVGVTSAGDVPAFETTKDVPASLR